MTMVLKKMVIKTCSKECVKKLFSINNTKYTKEQLDQVVELKKQFVTNKEIMNQTGVGINTIKKIVKDNNLYLNSEQIQINAHAIKKEMGFTSISYKERQKCLENIEKDILNGKGTAHGLAIQYGLNPNSVIGTFRKQNKNHLLGIKESTGQKQLYDFVCDILNKENILYNDRNVINPKELDIYISSKKVGIEYNGLHWHTENRVGRNAHYDKMKMANLNGIRLITIFEHEWLNREKQVKNFLKSVLSISNRTVGARKTEVKKLGLDVGKTFMNENHIQGATRTTLVYFGLFFEEPLRVISLGRHHRGTEPRTVVLDRLCFLDGVSVQGGSSKLLKHSIEWAKENGFNKVISWSNRQQMV